MPPNPPIRPQLPVQNTPNPNNKPVQQEETANLPTYCIFPVQCNDVHLRSGRIVQAESEPTIIEEEENSEIEEAPKKTVNPNPVVTINKKLPLKMRKHHHILNVWLLPKLSHN